MICFVRRAGSIIHCTSLSCGVYTVMICTLEVFLLLTYFMAKKGE
jgi:hypothetical protein